MQRGHGDTDLSTVWKFAYGLYLFCFREFRIATQGGRARVDDCEFVVARDAQDVVGGLVVRRCIHETRTFHECRGLGEPGGIPEGANLALGLVARAGAAVKAVKGRG